MAADVAPMSVQPTAIDGLLRISAKAASDERGVVREFFRASAYDAAGLEPPTCWQQINMTHTRAGAVRGLHAGATTKLVGVAAGSAFGAYLDARRDSPTFGTVVTTSLEVGVQMLVPAGVCNGFQALGPNGCQYLYCFSPEWRADASGGVSVRPTDPALGIDWPLPVAADDRSCLSAEDAAAPLFADLLADL